MKTFICSGTLFTILVCACTYAGTQAQLKHDILAAHNTMRFQHHAAKLIWDDELAAYAEQHASTCVFKHSYDHRYGENLASGYPSVTAAVNAWNSERANYSYSNPGFSHSTGHFTQVVWKATKRIGCANVACDGRNGTYGNYLVCEYSPPGNNIYRDNFSRNVVAE